VRVRVGAVGMSALGLEAAGTIEAVGPEAGGFAPGDRVVYRQTPETSGMRLILPERDLLGFPKDVSLEAAAGLLPLGMLARTVVKMQHPIGRGNRVFATEDATGVHEFVRAWAIDLGAEPVDSPAGAVVISSADYEAARRWRYGHGFAQQAAADVFQAVRRGVFDGIAVESYPLAHAREAKSLIDEGAGPIVLLPAAA
jgi:hypothetical protein